MTRRDVLSASALAALAHQPAAAKPASELVGRNDEDTARLLARQNTDPASRWVGGFEDAYGIYAAAGAGAFVAIAAAAWVSPTSKFYKDPKLLTAIQLAGKFLSNCQSPDGDIDLPNTNFNSPPDTGFVVHNVAEAASLSRKAGAAGIEKALEPFLRKAGSALLKGGVHTPNHRWVVSAAMAQIHSLWPDPAYVRRIDQWLAEGIDIDADGQFSERSTVIYNTVCDKAFTLMALKLKRPQLLDAVRKNLTSMMYLLHPDGEVVTEISRRQDLNERGTMDRYWLPLRTLAIQDGNGQFAAVARRVEPKAGSLSTLLDFPEIAGDLPADAPLPDNFEREFPAVRLSRIRRGRSSTSILLDGTSRFFTFRRGDVVIEAVRFASAFFGKGQFVPDSATREGKSYVLRQKLEAGYYQPLGEPVKGGTPEWAAVRPRRKVTEQCQLEQSAVITETAKGFQLRIQVQGTKDVPVTVEIGLREGSKVEGGQPLSATSWLAPKTGVRITRGRDTVQISPGRADHRYVVVRGAREPLPGPAVFLTGLSPFDLTFTIEAV